MIQILPALLATSEEEYKKDIEKINECSFFDEGWVHIDFMDNKFVQNKSIDPEIVKRNKLKTKKEGHAMVAEPLNWVEPLVNSGLDRIIFHLESETDPHSWIEAVKGSNKEVGIAINMSTPLEKVIQFMSKIDLLLVMSVVPGFQGQPFIPESLDRIKKIADIGSKNNFSFRIAVDGHVTNENAKALVEAGVDQLTIGSYFMKAKNLEERVEQLWELLNN